MILIALAGLCVLSVPLTGGRLRRLADIELRGMWIPMLALALQVVITVIATSGSPALHRGVHMATYVLLGLFLWRNRRLPGVPLIAAGALMNAVVIFANRGVMPASAWAQRTAGMHVAQGGFENSAHVSHALLPWLGDIIPWPGPLHNVLSPGDCVLYVGTLVLLHTVCRRPAPAPAAPPLTPVAE